MATVSTQIGLADNGRMMTLEEFDEADFEEGYLYELARGVLEVSFVPGELHGLIVYLFYKMFGRYDDRHPGVIFRYGGGNEYRLYIPAMISGRHPDVSVSLLKTQPDSKNFRPPALVVEVVSEGDDARERDYVTKREEYLAYGALEYWIVDPIVRRVMVLTREQGAWVERVFGDGEVAEGVVLPGFGVPVADLWVVPIARPETQGE